MSITERGRAIFEKFQSMMIDAIKSHTGLSDKPPGVKQARDNEAILWSVNAMLFYAARKQQLGSGEGDADIGALKAAIERDGLELPTIDPITGSDKFLNMVYYALRRKLQGGMPQGVLQYRKDEAILWAGYRLSHLADEVRDLEAGGQ